MKKLLLALGAAALVTTAPHLAHATPALASGSSTSERSLAIEFPREYVPASASLMAHLDLAAFQRTTLWKIFHELHGEEALAEARAELGVDPMKVLRSVTAYGRHGEPECAVIVATAEIEEVLRRFESEGKLDHMESQGLPLFSFEGEAVGFLAEEGADTRILVVGEDADTVVQGARVVLGEAPSLADDPSAKLSPSSVEGSFLSVSALDVLPGMDEFEPASQVLGLAQGVQFDLGEAGGSLFAHLSLDTGSVETARDVSDMVTGLLAMARLAAQANEEVPEELRQLMHSLTVRSRGGVVSVDFEYDTSALIGLLESLDGQGH